MKITENEARTLGQLAEHLDHLNVNLGGQTGNRIVYTLTQEEIQ